MENTNITTAITTKEQNTILKTYRTREQALRAVDKFDRAEIMSAFAVAWAWKQLKEMFQTEDCTLKDMCEERGLSPSTVSERIKVVNNIPPEFWGVYTMTQLVEITRLKGVDDWAVYPITETFPNTLSAKEIRKIVKDMNNAAIVSGETDAVESDNESDAEESTKTITEGKTEPRVDEYLITNIDINEYLSTVVENYKQGEKAIAISIRIEVENDE